MTEEERRSIEWDCQQLLNRVTNLLDQGRWQELADCYTEDAVLARPSDPDNPFRGREAILKSLLARPPRATCHMLVNSLFEVKSPTLVHAYSRVLLMSAEAGTEPPLQTSAPLLVGSFSDELEKTGDRWLIKKRQGTVDIKCTP
ncbi:nuclear transport factor 2 family protein [Emcibacter sp.]|uniref:nuclear transport factor 2 family protein n=1 Tax=Emcibacter sp. TaxID=1979954 RepID=UPI002AA8A5C4|nr:nuclear transport factor 2 family protein [Emcibacter sp.]